MQLTLRRNTGRCFHSSEHLDHLGEPLHTMLSRGYKNDHLAHIPGGEKDMRCETPAIYLRVMGAMPSAT